MFINQVMTSSIKELKTYQQGQILPVLTFHELLVSGSQRKLIEAIKHLLNVPEQYFTMLYEPLIRNFAEYVQLIPIDKEVHLGSLLYEGLLNAYYMLELYHENYGVAQDNRITYALFSAVLLQNIDKVISKQHIIMTDEEGGFRLNWVMTENSMLNQGEFYSLVFYNSTIPQSYFDAAKVVMARQLMGETGFSWIAAEHNVFYDWLAALFGNDDDLAGFISTMMNSLKKSLVDKDIMEQIKSFSQIDYNETVNESLIHVYEYLEWLRERFHTDRVLDSKSIVVDDGIVITDASLEEFAKQSGHIGDIAGFKKHLQQYLGAVETQLHGNREKSYSMLSKSVAQAAQAGLKISKALVTVVNVASNDHYLHRSSQNNWPMTADQKNQQQQSLQNNTLMGTGK